MDNEYAYEARVHFQRLDFLLRSSTISRIDLVNVAWDSGIDSSAIRSVESQKRRLFFTTTQQLNLDLGANLGIMSYKMDFGPLPMAIIWYYLWIIFAVLFASLTLSFSKAQSGALIGEKFRFTAFLIYLVKKYCYGVGANLANRYSAIISTLQIA